MLPEVTLISEPYFDTNMLFASAKKVLNRSITGPIDEVNANPEEYVSIIVALSELLQPGKKYHNAARNPGSILRHFSFTFLALGLRDYTNEVAQHTDLKTHCVNNLHLITGNLEQWRNAVINCSSDITAPDFRLLINKCMLIFSDMGLRDLWFEYKKEKRPDGTIRLLK